MSNKYENTRVGHVLKNGVWEISTNIKKGEMFKLFEQDGTPVIDKEGNSQWVAAEDEYRDVNGVRIIQIEAQPRMITFKAIID